MSQNDSMGFIETIGLSSAIQAADIMIKSANVKVETVANADAGLITVICRGDLASCQAAVAAAKVSVTVLGTYFNSNNIPRPSSDVDTLTGYHIGNMIQPAAPQKAKTTKKADK